MGMAERIREKLEGALAPEGLDIADESALHAAHAGARPGGETHFRVAVVSRAFAGLSRVERHRRVKTPCWPGSSPPGCMRLRWRRALWATLAGLRRAAAAPKRWRDREPTTETPASVRRVRR